MVAGIVLWIPFFGPHNWPLPPRLDFRGNRPRSSDGRPDPGGPAPRPRRRRRPCRSAESSAVSHGLSPQVDVPSSVGHAMARPLGRVAEDSILPGFQHLNIPHSWTDHPVAGRDPDSLVDFVFRFRTGEIRARSTAVTVHSSGPTTAISFVRLDLAGIICVPGR